MDEYEEEALRLVFLEKMADTALAKAEILRRLEKAPPDQLDKIYSALHQVRKVRRRLIAMYRRMQPPEDRGDDLEPA